MRARAVLLAAALGGCGTITAHQARRLMPGMSESALMRCVGPVKTTALPDGTRIDAVVYAGGKSPAFTVLLAGQGLALGASGACQAVFAVGRDGRVTAVHYEGAESSLLGREGACAPIVADCLDGTDTGVDE